MFFPRALEQSKTRTTLSRIWTQVTYSISFDNNHYTKCISWDLQPSNLLNQFSKPNLHQNVTDLHKQDIYPTHLWPPIVSSLNIFDISWMVSGIRSLKIWYMNNKRMCLYQIWMVILRNYCKIINWKFWCTYEVWQWKISCAANYFWNVKEKKKKNPTHYCMSLVISSETQWVSNKLLCIIAAVEG